MRTTKVHIAISALCFITIIICLSFGMSIFNAKDNQHITHLNDFESYSYNTLEDIPVLTAKAIIFSGIFLVLALGTQIYSYFIAEVKRKKQIILSLFLIYAILFFFSFFVMNNLDSRNFYDYGMIWVLLCLTLIFANSILIFLKK